MYAHQLLLSCHVFFSCLILALKKIKFMCVLCISERALATLYVGMGPVFSVLGGFDTPETHIRHVQNLILIAEMESAS